MLKLVKDLFAVAAFKQREAVEERHAADLIDLRVRESEASLAAAKNTLAALIVRQRTEKRAADGLAARIAEMETRVVAAMQAGAEPVASRGAEAIADMENELALRSRQLATLDERIERITASVEKASRRLTSLRQGAMTARAAIAGREAQRRIERSIGATTPLREAEALIAKYADDRDPFAEAQALDEIDNRLDHAAARDDLAAAGFGAPLQSNASQVLDRLARRTQN